MSTDPLPPVPPVPKNAADLTLGLCATLRVDATADAEGDLRIEIDDLGSGYDWINRQDAVKLIKHLQAAFSLNPGELL